VKVKVNNHPWQWKVQKKTKKTTQKKNTEHDNVPEKKKIG